MQQVGTHVKQRKTNSFKMERQHLLGMLPPQFARSTRRDGNFWPFKHRRCGRRGQWRCWLVGHPHRGALTVLHHCFAPPSKMNLNRWQVARKKKSSISWVGPSWSVEETAHTEAVRRKRPGPVSRPGAAWRPRAGSDCSGRARCEAGWAAPHRC